MKKIVLVFILCILCFFTISSRKKQAYNSISPMATATTDYYSTHFNSFQKELKSLVDFVSESDQENSF